MTAELLRLLGAALVAALTGGGLIAWINARARKPLTRAEAVERLNEATLEWAEQLKADAAGAREEAAEARKEAAAARREATDVRREMHAIKIEAADSLHRAQEVTAYLTQVIRWIQTADMSMERLRILVSQVGPLNGQK